MTHTPGFDWLIKLFLSLIAPIKHYFFVSWSAGELVAELRDVVDRNHWMVTSPCIHPPCRSPGVVCLVVGQNGVMETTPIYSSCKMTSHVKYTVIFEILPKIKTEFPTLVPENHILWEGREAAGIQLSVSRVKISVEERKFFPLYPPVTSKVYR